MIRIVAGSTAAAGSTTTDAGVLPASGVSNGPAALFEVTGADDTKGVRIAAADAVTGTMLFIGNAVSNKILKVYPPSGGTINGASADAAFSSASGKGVTIWCKDGANNVWRAS